MGVYNCLYGPLRKMIPTVHKYVRIAPNSLYEWGAVCGMPAIISSKCTKKGILKSMECGWVCEGCSKIRKSKGGSNPRNFLKNWGTSIPRCIDRRTRDELTPCDLDDAEVFFSQPCYSIERTCARSTRRGKCPGRIWKGNGKACEDLAKENIKAEAGRLFA